MVGILPARRRFSAVLTKEDDASHRSWFAPKPTSRLSKTFLRHADVKTTLGICTHSMAEDRLAAQGEALAAILHQPAFQPGEAN